MSYIVQGSGGTGAPTKNFFMSALYTLCSDIFPLTDVLSTENFTVVETKFNTDLKLFPVLKAVGKGTFRLVSSGVCYQMRSQYQSSIHSVSASPALSYCSLQDKCPYTKPDGISSV